MVTKAQCHTGLGQRILQPLIFRLASDLWTLALVLSFVFLYFIDRDG
jgi:hypothetical protein